MFVEKQTYFVFLQVKELYIVAFFFLFYNLAFIITIIPAAKSRLSSSDNSSNSILTGMRCCIFTKFPAELSVGTKEYLGPVAPDMADMCPENSLSGKASTLMLTF